MLIRCPHSGPSHVNRESVKLTSGLGFASFMLSAVLAVAMSGCAWLCRLADSHPASEDDEAQYPEPARLPEVSLVKGRGTVAARPEPGHPLVALQIWAARGTAEDTDDTPMSAGLCAELFCNRISSPPGVTVTSWASPDAMVCEIETPAGLVEAAIEHLTRLLSETRGLPAAEVETRCQSLEERWRTSRAAPRRVLVEHLFASAFTSHPYARPALRPPACDRVEPATVETCEAWFSSSSIVVAGAGDVTAERIARALSRGGWRPRLEAPSGPRTEVRERVEPRVDVVSGTSPLAHVALSFTFPPVDSAALAALELIEATLTSGPTSRLGRSPAAVSGRLLTPGGALFLGRRGGMIMLSAAAEPEHLDDVARSLLAVGLSLRASPLRGSELERGRSVALLRRARTAATASGSARDIGLGLVAAGDPGRGAKVMDLLARVPHVEVARIARQYLVPQRMTLVAVVPEHLEMRPVGLPMETDPDGQPRLATEQVEALLARIADEVSRAYSDERAGDGGDNAMVRFRLDGGPTVLVRSEPNAATVAVRASCPATSAWQSMNAASELALLADLLQASSGEPASPALSASAGHDVLSVTSEILPQQLEGGIASVVGVLLRPHLSQDALDQARATRGTRALSLRENPFHIGMSALREALHLGTQYQITFPGTHQALDATGLGQLQSLHRRAIRREEMIVTIVGPVTPERARRALTVVLVSTPLATGNGTSEAGRTWMRSPPVRQEIRLDVQSDRTWVLVGFATDGFAAPDWPQLEVLAALLDSDSGPLNRRLGAAGLARSVRVEAWLGARGGLLMLAVETAPGNEQRVAEVLDELVTELRSTNFAAAEVEDARDRAALRFAERLATPGGRASALETATLAGLPPDEIVGAGRRILEVGAGDLQRTIRAVLAPELGVLVIAGPAADRIEGVDESRE